MIKVSIIIPVYHVERYLSQCLDSVIHQTLDDLEIIIVNNGASLEEINIIKSYSNECIKIINFENNQGYGKAVNEGLKLAQGEYVGIVESDDYIEPDMFKILYEGAKKYDADMVKCSYRYFDKKRTVKFFDGSILPVETPFKAIDYPYLFSKHPSIWSYIYKRGFLEQNNIKFIEEKGTGWVDNPFSVECLIKANSIVYIPQNLYNYRVNHAGSSSTLKEGILIPYLACKNIEDKLKENNITNNGILENTALREWSYIKLILDKTNNSNVILAQEAVEGLFDLIGDKLSQNKNFLKFKKRFFKSKFKNYVRIRNFKRFCGNLISIRIIHKKLKVKLFNCEIRSII